MKSRTCITAIFLAILLLSSKDKHENKKPSIKKPKKDTVYCIQVYAPVCAEYKNGKKKTFSNTCFMNQAGAKKVSDGECEFDKNIKKKPSDEPNPLKPIPLEEKDLKNSDKE